MAKKVPSSSPLLLGIPEKGPLSTISPSLSVLKFVTKSPTPIAITPALGTEISENVELKSMEEVDFKDPLAKSMFLGTEIKPAPLTIRPPTVVVAPPDPHRAVVIPPTKSKPRIADPEKVLILPSLRKFREKNLSVNATQLGHPLVYPEETDLKYDEMNDLLNTRKFTSHHIQQIKNNIAKRINVSEKTIDVALSEHFISKEFPQLDFRKKLAVSLDEDLKKADPKAYNDWLDSPIRDRLVNEDLEWNFKKDRKRNELVGSAKTRDTIALLKDLVQYWNDLGRLGAFVVARRNYAATIKEVPEAYEETNYLNPDIYAKALLKHQINASSPTNVLRRIRDIKKMPSSTYEKLYNKNPEFADKINLLITEAENARSARENNLLTADDYDRINQSIFRSLTSDYEGKIDENEEADKDEIKNQYTQEVARTRRQETERYLKDIHIFNRLMVKIENDIKSMRMTSPLRQKIIDQTKQIMKDLKDGKIDITMAYRRANTLSPITRSILTNPNTLFKAKLGNVQEDYTVNVDPNYDNPDFYKAFRDRTNIWAFPNVEWNAKMLSGIPDAPVRNFYKIGTEKKKAIVLEIDNLLNTAKDALDEKNIESFDYEHLLKAVIGVKKTMDMSKFLRHMVLRPQVYPYLSRSTIDLEKLDPAKDTNELASLRKEMLMFAPLIKEIGTYTQSIANKRIKGLSEIQRIKERTLPPRGDFAPLPHLKKVLKMDKSPITDYIDNTVGAVRVPTAKRKTMEMEKEAQIAKFNKDSQAKFTFDDVRYSSKPVREWPESLKTEHYDGSIEYNVKTEEDLVRMKSEVAKKGGFLYIIDLNTGRLFPIHLEEAFPGAVYVWKKSKTDKGNIATNTARLAILRSAERKSPYIHLQDGNDKIYNMYHRLATKNHSYDYRDQIRNEHGGSVWGFVKGALNKVGDSLIHGIGKGSQKAVSYLASNANQEVGNFIKQEKRNVRNIYQSGSNLIRNPSWSSFSNAATGIGKGIANMALQPITTASRLTADAFDATNKIPGANFVKYGAEWLLPPLAIVDGLTHAVKDSGVQSGDKANYLKALIDVGNGVVGSGELKGPFDTAARVLSSGLQVANNIVN